MKLKKSFYFKNYLIFHKFWNNILILFQFATQDISFKIKLVYSVIAIPSRNTRAMRQIVLTLVMSQVKFRMTSALLVVSFITTVTIRSLTLMRRKTSDLSAFKYMIYAHLVDNRLLVLILKLSL